MTTPPFVHYAVLEVPNITGNTTFAGVFKQLSGLEANYEVLEYREGGNNDFVHRLPGRLMFPNLVLSWGIVNDDLLLKWFMQTHSQPQPQEISLSLAAAGGGQSGDVRKFTFTDAYPVRWAGPQLASDRSDPESWGETLEVAHSGLKLT